MHLYGLDGELVAEYTAGQPQTNPLREYGYRNGELLVTAGQSADIRWLVTDHLGTPRMTADSTGSLAGVRRHDYLPFGEEVAAGIGGRTTAQGYQPDNIRQQFTGYERDGETGLDYAQARYYASVQGRFISVDPLLASAFTGSPQSWNRYAYVLNNPLAYTDPTGMIWVKNSSGTRVWFSDERWENEIRDATDDDGNPLYTPLTQDEMEYNSIYGRVRLNPNGPDTNAAPGTDAYQGWSIIGDNTTDYSAAFAGGLLIGQRGRNPWLMLGGATIGTLWVLSNQPIGGPPVIDPNIYSRSRHNKDVVDGLIGAAEEELDKLRSDPPGPGGPREHHRGEIRGILDRARRVAERLVGRNREERLRRIEEIEREAANH